MMNKSRPDKENSTSPLKIEFSVNDQLKIVGDAYGCDCNPAVLFAHGGGQTRHAWGKTASILSQRGWYSISVDLRGHGESDWHPIGDYRIETFAQDLTIIASTFDQPPILIGASLGGVSGLIAESETDHSVFSVIILVDVAHRSENKGAERILSFMYENMEEGFANLQQAGEAIAAYLPNRSKSLDINSIGKNFRLDSDGRYRWHWDPKFLKHANDLRKEMIGSSSRYAAAARSLQIPTLLVRGHMSDVLSNETAMEFLELVPHAKFSDVQGGGHMIAGDRNDLFSDAIICFLESVKDTI